MCRCRYSSRCRLGGLSSILILLVLETFHSLVLLVHQCYLLRGDVMMIDENFRCEEGELTIEQLHIRDSHWFLEAEAPHPACRREQVPPQECPL